MEESVTYQAIITKGAKKEARKILLARGRTAVRDIRPSPAQTAIEAIDDLPRLQELNGRVSAANDWQDLSSVSPAAEAARAEEAALNAIPLNQP